MAKPVMGVLTRRKKVEKKQISTVSEEEEVLLHPAFCVPHSPHCHRLLVSEKHLSALSSGTVMYIVLLLFTIKIDNKIPITVGNIFQVLLLALGFLEM